MSVLIEHEAENMKKWLSDISVDEIEEKTNKSPMQAHNIKNGIHLSRESIRQIMEIYDVDTKTLLGETIPYFEHSLEDVGKRIRQARADVYMTEGELAEELNVNLRTLQKWERGAHIPDRYTLEEIAFITKLTDEEFFTMPLIDHKALGPYLKQIREERCMSKVDMGYVADVNSVTILKWERGGNTSKIQSLKYIADLVGISLREMAEISKEQFVEEEC